MKFFAHAQAADAAPLLPPDFRSEAFAEDLLDNISAARSDWRQDFALAAIPVGLAVLGGALPLACLPS
jgi:hypothetical protein